MANRGDLALSAHFRLREFAGRNGALPPSDSIDALRTLCVVALEPLRARYGITTVTSGYRTAAHNAAVGGARHSHHLYGLFPHQPAADVKCRLGTPRQWAALLDQLGVGGLGLYSGHVHVDLRRGRARW